MKAKRPVKFYVAAKWQDKDLVRHVYQMIRNHGGEITLDWTDHEMPGDLSSSQVRDFLTMWAYKDVQGVADCDYLIALFLENRHHRSSMIEVGAALGLGKPVIVVGHSEDCATLLWHPLCMHLDTLEELVQWLEEAPYV